MYNFDDTSKISLKSRMTAVFTLFDHPDVTDPIIPAMVWVICDIFGFAGFVALVICAVSTACWDRFWLGAANAA